MYNTINSLVSQAIEPQDNYAMSSGHGFSNAEIAQFVQANIGNPQAIANAAQQYGITPAEISRATGYSTQQIGDYFANAGINFGQQAAPTQAAVAPQVTEKQIQDFLAANPNMSDAQIVDAMEKNGVSPSLMAKAVGMSEGEVAARIAATIPEGQAKLLGDTWVQPEYEVTGSGEDRQVGGISNVMTYKTTGGINDAVPTGTNVQHYTPSGEPTQTTQTQKVDSGLKEFALGSLALFGGLGGGLESLFGGGAAAGTAGSAFELANVGAGAFGGGAATGAATVANTGMTLAELAQLDLTLGGAGGTAGALEMASTIGGPVASTSAATIANSINNTTSLADIGANNAFEAANAGASAMTDLGASQLTNAGASALTPTVSDALATNQIATPTTALGNANAIATQTIANTGMTLGELAQLDVALGGAGGTAGALEMAGTIGGATGVASAAAVVDALGGGTGLTAGSSGLGLTTSGGTGLTAGTSGLGGGLGTSLSNLTTGLGADLGTGLAAGATGLGLGGGTGLATGGTGLGGGLGGTLGAVDTGLATGLTGAGLGSELVAGGTGLTAGGTGLGGGLATDATLGAGLGAAGASGLGAGSSLGTGLTSGGLGLTAGTAGLGAEGLGAGLAAGAGGLAAGNSLLGGSALGSTLGGTMTGALGATAGSALGSAAGSTLGSGLGSALGTSLGTGIGLSALGTGLGALANQQGISQARDLINQYGTRASDQLANAYANAQGLNTANRTDLGNLYANTSGNLQNLYNQQVGYQAPYQDVGRSGTQGLIQNQPYFTHQFNADDLAAGLAPNYNFMLQQGQMANQRAANAGGGALGGNALQGLQRYTQDYAGNAYQNAFNNYNTQRNNIYNTLAGMAGIGQTSTGQLTNLGTNYGSNMAGLSSNYGGNLTTNAGQGIGAANAYGLNQANLATGIGSALATNATQQGANNASLLSNLGNTALLGSMIKAT